MDINQIEMYSSHDPFEVDDEIIYDYSFEDICSSFDSLEMQFVEGDVEQTVKRTCLDILARGKYRWGSIRVNN